MPIETQHADYAALLPMWQKCRDAAGGQECVHEKGEAYLPKLAEQTAEEYKAYKCRALYYNATGRTVDGLSGLIFRRPPTFDIPPKIDFIEDDADTAGTPLMAFCEKAVDELITTGRFGLLADFPPVPADQVRTVADEAASGARAYMTMFRPEAIINWRFERLNNRQTLTLVVIEEKHEEQKDEYTTECVDQLRALRLVNGQYLIEIHRKVKLAAGGLGEWALVETIIPQMAGKPVNFIPFLFCGPMGINSFEKPPILDLANTNLSHYMSTADYEHGLHFTGLPTPVITGHAFDKGETFALGSTQVRGFPNPDAKASFLEFAGTGLGALSTRLEEKEAMMASQGARMLAAEKRAAEAAETAAIHRSGENSVLASLANAAAAAISKAINWCVLWSGATGEASVELNTDYMPAGMTAQEVTSLVSAWQAGAISHETLYDNLQRGEIARQGVSFEDESAKIEEEGPPLGTLTDPGLDPLTGLPKKADPAVA